MAKRYEVTATYQDTCFSDYVPNHRWFGVPLNGQTREQIADDIVEELNSADYGIVPDDVSDEQIRNAVIACLRADARFWPVDSSGNEIETTDSDDPRLQEEQPYAWFTLDFEEIDDAGNAMPLGHTWRSDDGVQCDWHDDSDIDHDTGDASRCTFSREEHEPSE